MNWEQLKTIVWLRWRLTRNQWQRAGALGGVLAVLVTMGVLGLGGLSFVGGLMLAALGLGETSPEGIMGIWFAITIGFLVLWMIGLLTELQRSETIDLQRLMHLPVSLGQLFVLNYLASHLAFSIILMVPTMTGLALGLAVSKGFSMLLLLPLSWSMVLMISAWTYCLRGWLASLMNNPRRRRAIIMGITLAFILAAQLPNLYFNVFGRKRHDSTRHSTPEEVQRARNEQRAEGKAKFEGFVAMQRFVPPFWLPYGALRLAEHRPAPALFATCGCVGLGLLGLRRAYRGTVKFYLGETNGKPGDHSHPQPSSAPPTDMAGRKTLLDLQLPAVSDQAAAVALGTFRSMLRAPEVKMAWATAFIVMVIIGASVLVRNAPEIPAAAKPLVITGAMVLTIFMLIQFLANQFGFDREGFRAFVLSPVERRLILLGKNLATWPVGAVTGLVILMLLSIWLHLPLLAVLAGILQLATLLLLGSLAGNLLSILSPFKIQAGSMKPTKMPALAMLTMVVFQMLFPLVALPLFIPPLLEWLWLLAGWPAAVPVNLILSAGLLGLVIVVYRHSLHPLGRLLQQRELRILNTVTAGQE